MKKDASRPKKRERQNNRVSWRIWSRTWERMRETSKTEARERPKHSLEGARREDESQEGQGGLKFGWPSLSTVLSCVPIPLQFRQGIRGDRLYSKVVGLVRGRDENKQAEKKERERGEAFRVSLSVKHLNEKEGRSLSERKKKRENESSSSEGSATER